MRASKRSMGGKGAVGDYMVHEILKNYTIKCHLEGGHNSVHQCFLSISADCEKIQGFPTAGEMTQSECLF